MNAAVSRPIKIVVFLIYLAAVAWLCFGNFKPGPDIPRSLWGIPIDKCFHFVMFLPFPILGTLAFDFRSWWRALALSMLPELKNCEAHSTVILSAVDDNTFRRLGITMTCDPVYQTTKLYHK